MVDAHAGDDPLHQRAPIDWRGLAGADAHAGVHRTGHAGHLAMLFKPATASSGRQGSALGQASSTFTPVDDRAGLPVGAAEEPLDHPGPGGEVDAYARE
ncbi:hypothetical protein ACIG5E_28565 [Kitasatospora sp. NPDC053057]|uniref:hypothetical protein n=1 Tax=Kitasatospora sp. NPDC053057 TaxID=3364062 RepID=UPI0037C7CE6B